MRIKDFPAILSLFILFSNPTYAAEVKRAGEVLEEDSLVFTLEESRELQKRVEEAESNADKLEEYRELDRLQQEKIKTLNHDLGLKDNYIEHLIEMREIDSNRIKKLEKRANISAVKVGAAFTAGIATTILLLLVIDKTEDYMETN